MINSTFKWWFIYGAIRTGSSYMADAIGLAAKLKVRDLGVNNLYKIVGSQNRATAKNDLPFNWDKAFHSISENILENGEKGQGSQLDLVYKQAGGKEIADSYPSLVRMWGLPERIIFCFRDPSSYMSSAIKKFPNEPLERLQSIYVESFVTYNLIGGDRFEYNSNLSAADYVNFLDPLIIKDQVAPFAYKGANSKNFTPEMKATFDTFRQKNKA